MPSMTTKIFLTLLSLAVSEVTTSTQCDPSSGTCSNDDHTGLLQSRVRVSLEAEEDQEQNQEQQVYSYGPYPGSILDAKRVSKTGVVTERSLIDYFKSWAHGKLVSHRSSKLEHEIRTDSSGALLQTDSRALTVEEANLAYITSALMECPDQAKSASFGIVHAEARDQFGLRHVLMRTQQGALQYMATQLENDGKVRAVVADPPLCRKSLMLADQWTMNGTFPPLPPINGSNGSDNLVPDWRSGGDPILLHPSDPLVKDCLKLFHRTLFENCNKTANVTVWFAMSMIVDGLEVHMDVEVCGDAGCHPHHPECLFEHSVNHTDASLLEGLPPIAEEKAGLQATLRLLVPLCDVDHTDGTNMTDGNLSMGLFQTRAMGELSRYKGYEHINDELPKWSALETTQEAAASVDFRTTYSECYKGTDGVEVMRSQGTCGSCWAFASASTTMAAICISSKGGESFNSPNDRKEVSVQKMLSCAPTGSSNQKGCQGGSMINFNDGASSWGLTAEKNNVYQCGGGDPKKHFVRGAQACKTFPWGGTCSGSAEAKWWWGGAASVSGATAMESYIAQGYPLYVSCDVYENFMNHGSGIYSVIAGRRKGAHAMSALGYGIEGGVKYWLIQNSWGPGGWGVSGFGKMIRGVNIAGLEDEAFVVRAWAEGGTVPPCFDSNDGTRLSATGGKPYIPCSQAASGPFGNLCNSNKIVAKMCPKTCNKCSGYNGNDKVTPPSPTSPPTTPAPTTQPAADPPTTAAPPTAPPPAGCSDSVPSNIKLDGVMTPCSQLGRYCTYAIVQTNCPATCNKCSAACRDDDNFVDSSGFSCAEWDGYQCPAEASAKCPKACKICS